MEKGQKYGTEDNKAVKAVQDQVGELPSFTQIQYDVTTTYSNEEIIKYIDNNKLQPGDEIDDTGWIYEGSATKTSTQNDITTTTTEYIVSRNVWEKDAWAKEKVTLTKTEITIPKTTILQCPLVSQITIYYTMWKGKIIGPIYVEGGFGGIFNIGYFTMEKYIGTIQVEKTSYNQSYLSPFVSAQLAAYPLEWLKRHLSNIPLPEKVKYILAKVKAPIAGYVYSTYTPSFSLVTGVGISARFQYVVILKNGGVEVSPFVEVGKEIGKIGSKVSGGVEVSGKRLGGGMSAGKEGEKWYIKLWVHLKELARKLHLKDLSTWIKFERKNDERRTLFGLTIGL